MPPCGAKSLAKSQEPSKTKIIPRRSPTTLVSGAGGFLPMKPITTLKKWLAHRSRKPGTLVDTLVVHSTAGGSAVSSIQWLVHLGYSYHLIIERDGSVTKCVPLSKAAFHAGKSDGPQGSNVNEYSVGVCFAHRNDGKEQITHAQLDALDELVPEIRKQFPAMKYACTHFGISPGRKFDPRGFNVEAFAARAQLKPWKHPKAVWRLF